LPANSDDLAFLFRGHFPRPTSGSHLFIFNRLAIPPFGNRFWIYAGAFRELTLTHVGMLNDVSLHKRCARAPVPHSRPVI
jgi:hypothetical protein